LGVPQSGTYISTLPLTLVSAAAEGNTLIQVAAMDTPIQTRVIQVAVANSVALIRSHAVTTVIKLTHYKP